MALIAGTATHAMKSLLEHKADIIIGDYYLRPARLKFMDASVEYFNTDVVFVIPPGRDLQSLEKLLQPFSRAVWNAFLIFLLFTTAATFVIIRYMKLGPQSFVIFFDLISILLAVSTPRLPKASAARILLISFVIFCLVKQAAYVGALFKILQTDSKMKEVQTIDEMLDKRYQFYVYDLMFESIQNEEKILER